MTSHFSALTEAEQERLAVLMEECAEAIQEGGKILRHGYDSNNNGKMLETNRERLAKELGHIVHAINMLTGSKDVNGATVGQAQRDKGKNIVPYLHHQESTS